MLFTAAAFVSSFILLASAQPSDDAFHKGLSPGLARTPTLSHRLLTRDLEKRCTGTCEECFGEGYTLCPDSSIYCYLPGDDYYGLDSCTGDSSSDSTPTTTADASSSTSTSGVDDICYETGATCVSCFGPTYLDCPDGYHCYDPNDPLYDTCPEDTSSTSSTTCADQYGTGSIPCGYDSCYNPDEGDVCCGDSGYHCEDGYSCSSIEGKCCAPGSTASGCSDSGSGLLSSTYDYSTYDYSTYSYYASTDDSTFATSTDNLLPTTADSTATATGGSSTGVSQFADNGAGSLAIGRGLWVAAGVGALVL